MAFYRKKESRGLKEVASCRKKESRGLKEVASCRKKESRGLKESGVLFCGILLFTSPDRE